jgi:hypothetical protein
MGHSLITRMLSMTGTDSLTPRRVARGYRMADFCAREGVSSRTVWRWARRGLVTITRLAPRSGVRIAYTDPTLDPSTHDDTP